MGDDAILVLRGSSVNDDRRDECECIEDRAINQSHTWLLNT